MVVNEYFDALQEAASNSCPTCGINSIMYDHNTGETVCTNCGLVISSDAIDPGKEWSAYDLAESTMKERAGPSIMGKHREVMYTNFSIQKDGQGRTLPQSQQNRMRYLRRQNLIINTGTPESRKMMMAQNLTKKIVEKMRLGNNIYEEALFLYKKALGKDLVKGKSIDGFVGACVLSVIREKNLPRPIEEVAQQANIEPLTLSKFYRELVTDLSLKMPVDDPSKYVVKICAQLKFDAQIERTAIEILETAGKLGLIQGKRPKAIAAAALYLAARKNFMGITQEKLALSSDVSEVTLRNRIKELKANRCMASTDVSF